jgi:hypothetical protein
MAEGRAAKPASEGRFTKIIAFGTIALVVLGYLGVAATIHWWPFSSSPPPTSTPSPGPTPTPTPSATSTRLPIYYHGPVTLGSLNGRNFDTSPPSPSSSPGAFYYGGNQLTTGGSTTAGFARWTQGGTPTAAECQPFATANLTGDLANVDAGMKICFETEQGRVGLLIVQPGTTEDTLNGIATVWGS